MNDYMPKFRRINDILKEIKEIDPDTEFNWKIIQNLVLTNKLTKIKIGDAWLINTDELYKIFTKEKSDELSITRQDL